MPAMKKYELIEHTSDIGLKAQGETLAEAFASAAAGMYAIMVDLEEVRETESRRVEVSADDVEGLLYAWLNGLLYYLDTEGLLFRRFDVLELTDTRLVAECRGETYDASRHHLKTGVKAATYHRLEVDRVKNRVQVIFDI